MSYDLASNHIADVDNKSLDTYLLYTRDTPNTSRLPFRPEGLDIWKADEILIYR